MTNKGSSFTINQSDIQFHLPIWGRYNVMNALAAMLTAKHFGISFDVMNHAFSKLKLSQMRMEQSKGLNGSYILNDAYNASPTSMKAVLHLVSELEGFEKKIVVLGDMLELGPDEKKLHREIGELLDPEKIHYVYTYGKLAKYIAQGAEKQFEKERVFSFENKDELIGHLKKKLEKGTFVLLKASRGMKLEEVAEAIKN